MVGIKPASREDLATVAGALGAAFAEDPIFTWMIGRTDNIQPRLEVLFGAIAKQVLRRPDHLTFVSEDGTGAAIWHPIDKWKVPPLELLRAMPGVVSAMRARVPVMIGALNSIEKNHPTEPHYYLEMLGTRPENQSKGVGSAMVSVMLERCDAEGVPAYLESSNPRNIPFYARHGFEVRDTINVGKGAPTVTTMWREPRS